MGTPLRTLTLLICQDAFDRALLRRGFKMGHRVVNSRENSHVAML